MQNNALRTARELTPPVRAAFESVLGRRLADDETVSIHTYQARPAPNGSARDAAYQRLIAFGDQLAQRVQGVPEEEIDAAMDEALDYVEDHPE